MLIGTLTPMLTPRPLQLVETFHVLWFSNLGVYEAGMYRAGVDQYLGFILLLITSGSTARLGRLHAWLPCISSCQSFVSWTPHGGRTRRRL